MKEPAKVATAAVSSSESIPLMRSAEKARIASCLFADEAARCSIAVFRTLCPSYLQEKYETNHTVLSAILVQWKESKQLEVLSLATGTKVLQEDALQCSRIASSNVQPPHSYTIGDEALRDMHAEVLARRGLIRYLMDIIVTAAPLLDCPELENRSSDVRQYISIPEHPSDVVSSSNHYNVEASNDEAQESKRLRMGEGHGTLAKSASASFPIADLANRAELECEEGTASKSAAAAREAYERLRQFFEVVLDPVDPAATTGSISKRKWSLRWLKEKVSLHLYTSSAPCGNACLKQFAKKNKNSIIAFSSLDAFTVPDVCWLPAGQLNSEINRHHVQLHEAVQFTHVAEGQVAVTIKVNTNSKPKSPQPSDAFAVPSDDTDESSPLMPVTSGRGRSLSCSDKILRWNCTGIQGGLLSSLLHVSGASSDLSNSNNNDPRMLLESVVIGRKYSEHHATRALCCRGAQYCLPSVTHPSSSMRKRKDVHHPAVLCTAVKLHEGGLSVAQGAVFQEHCIFAAFKSPSTSFHIEVIDSRTGKLHEPSEGAKSSSLCSAALAELYCKLDSAHSEHSNATDYQGWKRNVVSRGTFDYNEATHRLFDSLKHVFLIRESTNPDRIAGQQPMYRSCWPLYKPN